MKNFLFSIFFFLSSSFPVLAQQSLSGAVPNALRQVEAQYVCMVNNTVFDKPQIPVEVGGKVYYGCCPMCKDKLTNDATARTTKDPVSGKEVDKASAIIGATPDGKVYYFENTENLAVFTPPKPETTKLEIRDVTPR